MDNCCMHTLKVAHLKFLKAALIGMCEAALQRGPKELSSCIIDNMAHGTIHSKMSWKTAPLKVLVCVALCC